MVRGSLQVAFGQVLARLRHEAGLSQEELAFRSGVHRTFVSDIERGIKSPALGTIERLALALGREPHSLVRAAEEWQRSMVGESG